MSDDPLAYLAHARRHSALGERRYEPRLATEARLEFIMGQIAKLPTRRELIRFGMWVALGLCVLALVGLRMWDRLRLNRHSVLVRAPHGMIRPEGRSR